MRGRIGYASGPLAGLRHRRLRLGRRALPQYARRSATTKSTSTSGSAGPPAPASNTPSRRTGACRLEYLYSQFDRANVRFPSGAQYSSTLDFQQIRIGLNRKIDWPGSNSWTPKTDLTDPESDRWEIHGQTTYLPQGYPAFRAPYTGTNSLTPAPQAQATWSNSLYLNARLWEGGEVYYNPELLQGFGLNDTVGAGGLSQRRSAEIELPLPALQHLAAVPAPDLRLRRRAGRTGQRPAQLAGKVDVSRLTLQAGKFAVIDVFDGNAYAKDTRKDFMNWSMWAPGAFDYSADKLGLDLWRHRRTQPEAMGAARRLFPDAVRYPTRTISTPGCSQRGSYVVELETRYSLFSQPGQAAHHRLAQQRLFRQLPRNAEQSGAQSRHFADPHAAASNMATSINLEQAVTDDIGLFGRWSWNDGKTEIMAFTDIDASLSMGTSIKGTKWGRPDDVIGIGGAINALSRDHRDFIAAGGLGVLDRRRRSSTTARSASSRPTTPTRSTSR